jgi:hypothetical protein
MLGMIGVVRTEVLSGELMDIIFRKIRIVISRLHLVLPGVQLKMRFLRNYLNIANI